MFASVSIVRLSGSGSVVSYQQGEEKNAARVEEMNITFHTQTLILPLDALKQVSCCAVQNTALKTGTLGDSRVTCINLLVFATGDITALLFLN